MFKSTDKNSSELSVGQSKLAGLPLKLDAHWKSRMDVKPQIKYKVSDPFSYNCNTSFGIQEIVHTEVVNITSAASVAAY